MIALIQRVTEAKVEVEGEIVGKIGPGLLALVGVERGDGAVEAQKLADRVVAYRVFADAAGKMNLSVRDVAGSLLLVSQFTLVADTSAGLRPSFSRAAVPALGAEMFERFVAAIAATGVPYACGRFGAHMRVSLVNDGPVTFWLRVPPSEAAA